MKGEIKCTLLNFLRKSVKIKFTNVFVHMCIIFDTQMTRHLQTVGNVAR